MKLLAVFLGFFVSFGLPAVLAQQSPLAPPVIPKSVTSSGSTTLKLGDRAPDFSLPNGDGKLIALSQYTARSPVVLVFYRGYW